MWWNMAWVGSLSSFLESGQFFFEDRMLLKHPMSSTVVVSSMTRSERSCGCWGCASSSNNETLPLSSCRTASFVWGSPLLSIRYVKCYAGFFSCDFFMFFLKWKGYKKVKDNVFTHYIKGKHTIVCKYRSYQTIIITCRYISSFEKHCQKEQYYTISSNSSHTSTCTCQQHSVAEDPVYFLVADSIYLASLMAKFRSQTN